MAASIFVHLGFWSRLAAEDEELLQESSDLERIIGEITVETTTEDMLTRVFETFCIDSDNRDTRSDFEIWFRRRTRRDDTLFNERASFVQLFARCGELSISDPVCDSSGISDFNCIVPRNYGNGPECFIVNIRSSKAFEFGKGSGPTTARRQVRRPFWESGRRGGGRDTQARYSLQFTVQVRNLFNSTDLSAPVGNINSPLFGESLSTAGVFGFGRGSSAGRNRRIDFEVQFDF